MLELVEDNVAAIVALIQSRVPEKRDADKLLHNVDLLRRFVKYKYKSHVVNVSMIGDCLVAPTDELMLLELHW